MRKVVVLEHISLDGVVQGPGRPDEDTSDDFSLGGWIGDFTDEVLAKELRARMTSDFDLLLGRKTYEIWAPYWSLHADIWPQAARATKFVASRTLASGSWSPARILSDDLPRQVRHLKQELGPPLHVWGSPNMSQTLFAQDLVDAVWLMVYPLVLGKGKRLFQAGAVGNRFELTDCTATTKGVVVLGYERRTRQ